MSDFWLSVVAGLVSSILYTIVIAVFILLVTIAVVRRERQRLFVLLGLHPETPVLRIFVSRLDVVRGGTQGTDGRLEVGFVGPALMKMEYTGALTLEQLVKGRYLEILPAFLRLAVQRRNSYLKHVLVSIDVSPDEHSYASLLQNGTEAVVLLGSDVYSHAVRDIYSSSETFIKFVSENTFEDFDASKSGAGDPTFAVRTDHQWVTIPGRGIGRELGTIQRVTLRSGRRVVLCAGISSSATCGSVTYLCTAWRQLCDRFGTDDFLVVLSFRDQQADSPVTHAPEELRDFERRRSPGGGSPRQR